MLKFISPILTPNVKKLRYFSPMVRSQRIVLLIAAVNLAAVFLFPPYDYLSLHKANIPTFAGFQFAFSAHPNSEINQSFLALEAIVVLLNTAIAWLLFKVPTGAKTDKAQGATGLQRGVLGLVAVNLVVVLLFPPFENYSAVTQATIPTFEGFYFVFSDHSKHQLISAILYIEIALVLINGGLLWLLFKRRGPEQLSPEELRAIAAKLRREQSP